MSSLSEFNAWCAANPKPLSEAQTAERRALFESLSSEDQVAYCMEPTLRRFEGFTLPEAPSQQTQSPSGAYRVDIYQHDQYSLGRVFAGDHLITEVYRNYCVFPVSWVEGHPNGHDYLVTGFDYQCQTFVELDTGRRRDQVDPGFLEGFGWCWTEGATFIPEAQYLIVEGCYWACPYEYLLFDFADPMTDVPCLDISIRIDSEVDDEGRSLTKIQATPGVIECHQLMLRHTETLEWRRELEVRKYRLESQQRAAKRQASEDLGSIEQALEAIKLRLSPPGETEDEEDREFRRIWTPQVISTQRWECSGGDWVALPEVRCEDAQRWEDERAAAEAAHEALLAQHRQESEIYQCALQLAAAQEEKLKDGRWYGSIHAREIECSDPNPYHYTVSVGGSSAKLSATIQWGQLAGDVELVWWRYGIGNKVHSTYPRSPEGFTQAWEAGKALVRAGV